MSQLVSVPVLTYNASDFIIETLESIFDQTHINIQLIISDDCSKDNTILLVEKWCQQDRVQKRFADIIILTVEKNTGVSANCNRCIAAAHSEWIKFIGGDDILLPNCIEKNLKFITENTEAKIVFSQVLVYQNTFDAENMLKGLPTSYPDNLMRLDFTALDQFNILLRSDRITYTPSYFFNKSTIESIGGYDESSQLVEDYPMWLNLTKAGIRLHYFHRPTVGYGIHANATNNTGDVLFKPSEINGYLVRREYAHPYLSWLTVREESWKYSVTKIFQYFGITKSNAINKILYKISTVYANPFFVLDVVRRRIYKNE